MSLVEEDEHEDNVYYLNLEIVPDPSINEDKQLLKEFKETNIDSIIWNSIILTSLNKMYGLIGESSPFEIPTIIDSKSIILKIQIEDFEKFNNSFISYIFNLSKFYSALNINCQIRINKFNK
ncbi:unnamed protein product [Candida verbasci]|uniref:Ribonucleases P/MRP subunit Pop8-like domain-containing protein n=1 Tax=Candida verbasci TaxID=1227364 RepID=A0A9W4XCH4_9ASCO|nr:unnamed protein product [Candida verbasci]